MTKEELTIDKFSSWVRSSVTLKLATITVLGLLLLIPTAMIINIIEEREHLSNEATSEVSSKWAGSQTINGPLLVIPLTFEYEVGDEEEKKTVTTTKHWFVLPQALDIDGRVEPQSLRRGLYEVVVYSSQISVEGSFLLDGEIDSPNLKRINYDQAFLSIGISDLRGIKSDLDLKWGGTQLDVEPGSRIPDVIYSGVTVSIPELKHNEPVPFAFTLDLRGSRNLSFVPLGNTTRVDVNSPWTAPSFNGNFLPDTRELRDSGFSANWEILQLNRNYPQSWVGTDPVEHLYSSAFGFDLLLPLDDYQKSMRSAKYAIMTIALTFLIFFLVEIHNKRRIHPFQYTLVGLSLSLFYILLVSVTEHTNFNLAYAVSGFAVVAMISLYSLSVFKDRKLTLALVASLVGIYGFLFVTLQLADYALLMGSVGLLAILATTMYFTRNINWYRLSIQD